MTKLHRVRPQNYDCLQAKSSAVMVVGLQVLQQPNIKAPFAGLPWGGENTNVQQPMPHFEVNFSSSLENVLPQKRILEIY